MPSPFVYRLINGYINGSTIKVGQGRKAFFGFTPTIDTEPYFFTPKSKTSGNLIIATCFNQFSFYGFTPTIDREPFLFTVLPRLCPDF